MQPCTVGSWSVRRCCGLGPSPLGGREQLRPAAVVLGEDLQGQVLVLLPLRGAQALQGLQLDEGLRALSEAPVGRAANG